MVYQIAVLKLVTRVDGCSFVLFHVEQQEMEWGYRWRMVGDFPPAYLAWRSPVKTSEWIKVVQCDAEGCRVEVEWHDGDGDWKIPEHVQFQRGQAEFKVEAKANVRHKGFRHSAFAVVRDSGVARFDFRAVLDMVAGEVQIVKGVADAPCVANLLIEPGEFRCEQEGVVITNVSACVGAWKADARAPMLRKVESRGFVYAKGNAKEVNDG